MSYIITATVRGDPYTHEIDALGDVSDDIRAAEFIADFYPDITPDERLTIRVTSNGMKVTNAVLLKAEQLVRERGWSIISPIGKQRAQPHCKECHGTFIKIGRDEQGMIRAVCVDCKREVLLTNGQYYVDLVDEDQLWPSMKR